MCAGELRILTVPPSLAYGDKGLPPLIPGGVSLVFEMQLKAIEDGGSISSRGIEDMPEYKVDTVDSLGPSNQQH
jgi:hypothetical protein